MKFAVKITCLRIIRYLWSMNMTESKYYRHTVIEPKWQKRWEADGLYHADIDPSRKKHYALTMLPYPSGDLHIGHWYAMTPSDARARFMRMRGLNVMFPMGFDAFGLPAENAAIKNRIHPKQWTYANIEKMRAQLKTMGAMFDWRREMVSSDPGYYRWSQWFFTKLHKNGMAYRKMSPVDWCPNCNTTLAREQVWGEDRHCERCGTQVIKKDLEQWFFRTTRYAEELLDFSHIDWPERIKTLQTHWIGRSEGAEVNFKIDEETLPEGSTPLSEDEKRLTVFTTRPDTLWGATFMVLAPEHPLVKKITSRTQEADVSTYIQQAERQSDIQREAVDKEKTGIFTGGYAVNPVNNRRIPVWIADYVLMTYGTGAIMAVPAHDERDFEFALKYGLHILPVIARTDGLVKSVAVPGSMRAGFTAALENEGIPYEEKDGSLFITIPSEKVDRYLELAHEHLEEGFWNEVIGAKWKFVFSDRVYEWDSQEREAEILDRCKALEPGVKDCRTLMEMLWNCEFYRDALFHHDYGTMINSGEFSGTPGEIARYKVSEWLEEKQTGKPAVNYRLRDWLISRQRYWGAPIPVIYCPEHGAVDVPEDELPVVLPEDVEWLPTGESPLKLHPTWKKTTCPICGEPAERETDTMDTFMDSSWYHLRYLSANYDQGPFDPKEYDYWMPVDTYTGGIEHATMHLIYTRFFHKACRDMGIVRGPEPMTQLRNQGIILGEDSEKMSKSRGNVAAPDELVNRYGADTVRAYLMFFARWDMGAPWSSSGIEGTYRWLRRVWSLVLEPAPHGNPSSDLLRGLRRKLHQTLRRVTHDFETFEFNTIVSAMMELLNEMYRAREQGAGGSKEWQEAVDIYLRMLAPVAPHIAEELWETLGKAYSIHNQDWPQFNADAAAEEQITLVVQVNGKVRDRVTVPAGIDEESARQAALDSETVQKILAGKQARKVIVVPGRLVNIVI
jgi:leucyl-tRNA synthetase